MGWVWKIAPRRLYEAVLPASLPKMADLQQTAGYAARDESIRKSVPDASVLRHRRPVQYLLHRPTIVRVSTLPDLPLYSSNPRQTPPEMFA